jgi:hypothetical protein
MTAPPATDCFFKGRGKTAFSASAAIGPRIRRHGRILIPIGAVAVVRHQSR